MDTKLCIDCKTDFPLENFYKQKCHSKGVMSYCKSCFNKRCILRWIQRKIKYINYMGGQCNKCKLQLSNSHYSVFEFHHKFDLSKDYDWSKLRLRNHKSILEELNKCELLCANCHRLTHAEFRSLDFPDQVKSQ